jgi:hypothetical protein
LVIHTLQCCAAKKKKPRGAESQGFSLRNYYELHRGWAGVRVPTKEYDLPRVPATGRRHSSGGESEVLDPNRPIREADVDQFAVTVAIL